jgi:hypothetical protein
LALISFGLLRSGSSRAASQSDKALEKINLKKVTNFVLFFAKKKTRHVFRMEALREAQDKEKKARGAKINYLEQQQLERSKQKIRYGTS